MSLKRVEKVVVAYGTEFLVSLAWIASYASTLYFVEVDKGNIMSAIYGANLVTAFIVWPLLSSALIALAPADNIPRVTAGIVVLDMAYEAPSHSDKRRVRPDSIGGSIARLFAQWLGGFVGYAFLLRFFPHIEHHLFAVWNSLGSSMNGFVTFGFLIALNGISGAMWLRQAEQPIEKTGPGRFLSALHTGAWVVIFAVPWGGPSFSMASYLWLQNGYWLASVVIPGAMIISAVASGLLAIVLFEALREDTGAPVFATRKIKSSTK